MRRPPSLPLPNMNIMGLPQELAGDSHHHGLPEANQIGTCKDPPSHVVLCSAISYIVLLTLERFLYQRPLLVSLVVYLDENWPRDHDAETLFLDSSDDVGIVVRPKVSCCLPYEASLSSVQRP